jgi:hypothetical protein
MRETIIFNGVKYHRYPKAKQRSHRIYFQAHTKWKETPRYLHRDIWEFHHGQIPEGCEIHHIDFNSLNNDISNLECLTEEEHDIKHAERGLPCSDAQREHLSKIRDKAAAWHRSKDGLAWHAKHAKLLAKLAEERKPIKKICAQCKNEYDCFSNRGNEKFCSKKCLSAARRQSGVDDEERTCAHCGTKFTCSRYAKVTCCSRSCGVRFGRARKIIGV